MDKGDDEYELIDGQQRTISICEYVEGNYSVNYKFFHNLDDEEQDKILDYELMIYICEGTDQERLGWFETINIAGEKLTKQELRNAVYTGPWLTDAKRYFSKPNNSVKVIGADKYLKGSAIRQDYLETVLRWISDGDIESYMAEHQHDAYAKDLWEYFDKVIAWVRKLFPTYRREMKGIEWGLLYNNHKSDKLDSKELEKQVASLMSDDEVQKKQGIYYYLLTGDSKYLNLRTFSDKIKREVYEGQDGVCTVCNEEFDITEMEADHIVPWSKGGKTTKDNCQLLCKKCNREKSDK
jgi:hypothetical protein